jgi:hypothetical protein
LLFFRRVEKTGHRGFAFAILPLLIGLDSSPPERMADEISFLPNQIPTASLVTPAFKLSKDFTVKGLRTSGPIAAFSTCWFSESRRTVKTRFLAKDGIG